MAMSDIGVLLGNSVLKGVNHFTSIPVETQEKILLQIMEENKNTEYGKKIGFDKVHSVEDFQKIVPLSNYDTLVEVASEIGYIKESHIEVLKDWRFSPSTWGRDE